MTVYDPWASPQEVLAEYGLEITKTMPTKKFDAIVLAVAHKEFLDINLREMLNGNGVLYDIKSVLRERVDGRL